MVQIVVQIVGRGIAAFAILVLTLTSVDRMLRALWTFLLDGIHYLGYKMQMTESAAQPLQLFVEPKKSGNGLKNYDLLMI